MLTVIVAFALMQPGQARITTVAQGSYSGIDERTEASVTTAADWQALWKTHGGSGTAAPVDFTKEIVAAVFLGTRPTGGHSVEIVSSRREGNALIVEFVEHRPPADAIVTQALTSPFHIVRLPKPDGPVRFRNVSPPPPGR